MRSLSLTRYTVAVHPDGQREPLKCPKCGAAVEQPDKLPEYDVRGSIVEILFAREQQLTATETLERDKLAHKILDWPDETLLLEEAEYAKVKQSLEALRGFTRNDVEFIRRINGAPEVSVKQAEPTNVSSP